MPNGEKIIGTVLKIALLILVPIVLSFLFTSVFPIPAFSFRGEEIGHYLAGFKSYAPITYLILQATTVLLVPIPSVILATAAGTFFGFWSAVPPNNHSLDCRNVD